MWIFLPIMRNLRFRNSRQVSNIDYCAAVSILHTYLLSLMLLSHVLFYW